MIRYNFQRIRKGIEMAEGIAVHADDLEAAVLKAHEILRRQYPQHDRLRFIGNDPCPPLAACPICVRQSAS